MRKHHADANSPSQPDRREAPRCGTGIRVDVACRAGAPGQGLYIALALLDVSASGARLLVDGAVTVGQVLEVCLYPAAPALGVTRAARVAWVAEAPGGFSCVGVQFETPLDPEATKALRLSQTGPP